MAKRENFKMSESERRRRVFSEDFKRKKVQEIERKITTIAEVSREYEVRANNVSKWLLQYGSKKMKEAQLIVESESDTRKLLELRSKIAELERIIGQKQLLLDFKDKMIVLAEETYQVDIKKKFGTTPSFGIG